MSYYPILLKIEGKECLVVGGGRVAERKIKGILSAGGKVRVVSPNLTDNLSKLYLSGKIDWKKGQFKEEDLEDIYLVIAATNDKDVNRRVAEGAKRRGILVNVVDSEESSSFIVPSVLRRGDLILTVSTSGKSPALARKIREDLERSYGDEYGKLLEIIFRVRRKLLEQDKHLPYERWRKILDRGISELMRGGKEEVYNTLLKEAEI